MLQMHFSQADTRVPPIPTWSPEATAVHVAHMRRAVADLTATGELVEARGLAMPDTARIVRSTDGAPGVTGGPFPDGKEFLFGWWLVDCADEARAVEIAARLSATPGHDGKPMNMPIEIRELMSEPPAAR
ncbi:YciI family protein [Kitasatospora phosalacinea]|uniref:YciI family protein n=1 Tax=Kitasatospora phosalacinea TaxID=2065 RepID=UPI000525158B|nr:YciI family protein [Kitasatospora phosalacinea]